MRALRTNRLARRQRQLRDRGIPAFLRADPINIRSATGVRNMQPWSMHSNLRIALVPAEGGVVLFDISVGASRRWPGNGGRGARGQVAGLAAPGDRPDGVGEQALRRWAEEIVSALRAFGGGISGGDDRHVDHFSALALGAAGVTVLPGQMLMRGAQTIKTPEEIAWMSVSIAVAETALFRMRDMLEPGRSEIDLWAMLERTNVEMGGEYMDTRLLSPARAPIPATRRLQTGWSGWAIWSRSTPTWWGRSAMTPISAAPSTAAPAGPAQSSAGSIAWPEIS